MAASSPMARFKEESCFKTFLVVTLSCWFPELPVTEASFRLRHTHPQTRLDRPASLLICEVKALVRDNEFDSRSWCFKTSHLMLRKSFAVEEFTLAFVNKAYRSTKEHNCILTQLIMSVNDSGRQQVNFGKKTHKA